jgi:hypothetical protein
VGRARLGAMIVCAVLCAALACATRPQSALGFSLCGSKIKSAAWVHSSLGWTLSVVPSECGRITAHVNARPLLDQAADSATPPSGEPHGWEPNAGSLLEQLQCHVWFVSVVQPNKAAWNLDSWRPTVPWSIEVFDLCNPPPSGLPVIPPVLSSGPGSPGGGLLPTLPPVSEQPISPLPILSGAGVGETTGGVTQTWSNYADAGGSAGPSIGANAAVDVTCRVAGFKVADGNTWWYQISSSPWNNAYYASADAFYNNGATSGSLVGTPWVDTDVPPCSQGTIPTPAPTATPTPNPPSTFGETTGGVTHTWTDYTNAGGTEGPSIPSNDTVQITCRIAGFQVADGNTWWYQIASSPWNNAYYASADAFYNNGATSGSLVGTPWVDTNVPTCAGSAPAPTQPTPTAPPSPSPSTYAETTGGVTHTWTNYTNAGGTEGPSIPSNDTVQITCRLTGFKVADGNTWWYQIASSPWINAYYASADAFYNNGATSGSLVGTPWVDTNVPVCGGSNAQARTATSKARTWLRSRVTSTILEVSGDNRSGRALLELWFSGRRCGAYQAGAQRRTPFTSFYVASSNRFSLTINRRALSGDGVAPKYLCAYMVSPQGRKVRQRASARKHVG